MTKLEFMESLDKLLADMSVEDRREALAFYEDYFVDAGVENEERVIRELESPERIAKIIKADLSSTLNSFERGEMTERGYRDPFLYGKSDTEIIVTDVKTEAVPDFTEETIKEAEPVRYVEASAEYREIHENPPETNGQEPPFENQNFSHWNQSQWQNGVPNPNQNYYQQPYQQPGIPPVKVKKPMSPGRLILIILAVIFIGLPIGLPMICIVFALFVSIGAVVISLIAAFCGTGFGLVVGGVFLFFLGIVKLFTIPMFGLMFIGGGLIILGIGLLLGMLGILVCTKVLPALVRGFVALVRIPFKNRSVAA